MSKEIFERDQVVQIVTHVARNLLPPMDALWRDLHRVVTQMQADLATSGPAHIRALVPDALSEMAAIRIMMEEKAATIMGACEALGPEVQDSLKGDIMEACTAFDIMRQRADKVSRALERMDEGAAAIEKILRERFADLEADLGGSGIEGEGAGLMTGPQLPGKGLSQEEIDALLDSF
ncbi:MAG TPA: hypothetical protein DDX54_00870 [Rhodospirillaceae bacterium]|jgi:chemotaxis protein CheZ|nr:hypothetical protein [Alphaproteobacteria bacterium]HBH25946.1 hypothetical protein [Rhodospirillaceae bacterium]